MDLTQSKSFAPTTISLHDPSSMPISFHLHHPSLLFYRSPTLTSTRFLLLSCTRFVNRELPAPRDTHFLGVSVIPPPFVLPENFQRSEFNFQLSHLIERLGPGHGICWRRQEYFAKCFGRMYVFVKGFTALSLTLNEFTSKISPTKKMKKQIIFRPLNYKTDFFSSLLKI